MADLSDRFNADGTLRPLPVPFPDVIIEPYAPTDAVFILTQDVLDDLRSLGWWRNAAGVAVVLDQPVSGDQQ